MGTQASILKPLVAAVFSLIVVASVEGGELPALHVSDNGRFLVTADGSPFFWLGDTAWAVVHKHTREQAQSQPSVLQYFKSRAARKFNVIQCQLVQNAATADAYGHKAFVDGRFDQPRIVEGRDNDYWDTADWFIAQAKAHGLYLALLPTWFDAVPNDDPMIKDPAVAYRYGHFIGTRYRNQPHIVWVLGGDPDRRSNHDVDHPPRLAATRGLAEGLADAKNGVNQFDGKADYSTTLMTYHPRGGGQSSSRLLHNEGWLDFNMIQTTSHLVFTNYKTVGDDYARQPAKPTLEAEVAYEYSVDLSRQKELDKRIGPWHVRKAAYWNVFAGGFGFTYGHRSYIAWVRAGESLRYGADIPWFESLDAPGAFDMTHLRDLMESRPFLTRVPDQSFVTEGPSDPLDYVAATRSSDGSYAMFYFPTGKTATVRMDKISGDGIRAWWFDPREGKAVEIGLFPNSGSKQFVPPSNGQDNDWLLVLDDAARNFSPPGIRGQGKESSVHVRPGDIGSALDYFPPPDSRGGWRTLNGAEEIRRVAGMELQEYLQKHLAEPMGWGRWGYGYKYAKEVTHTPGGGGITLRATDVLRFGYLLLREGRWGERQLVPAEYVRHCGRQSPYNPHSPYSLQFDVNTDGHYPEYPRDAFWKSGSGAHMLYVVPSLDLVVWKLAGRDSQYEQRDTGVPLAPEIAKVSDSCRNWKPTIEEREGQRLLLTKVIEAIVVSGSSAR